MCVISTYTLANDDAFYSSFIDFIDCKPMNALLQSLCTQIHTSNSIIQAAIE